MPDAQDMDLVREFARHNSEAAFTELVRRHIALVYSVARRCTGNDSDAQDVTQAVFIILARKAAGLRERTLLPGWLYETTRFTAARLLRTNVRRQQREQEAYMQSTLNEADTADVWEKLSPHLEDAMSKLAERDRALLVLRFYQNKSGPEAAALLGLREAAVHKRTARALEKLRKIFIQRGIALSTTVIAGAVMAYAVQAAPTALAAKVSLLAAKGAATTTPITALVKGTMKTMTWMKIKFPVAISAIVLVTGGLVTVALSGEKSKQVPVDAVARFKQAISSPLDVDSFIVGQRSLKSLEELNSLAQLISGNRPSAENKITTNSQASLQIAKDMRNEHFYAGARAGSDYFLRYISSPNTPNIPAENPSIIGRAGSVLYQVGRDNVSYGSGTNAFVASVDGMFNLVRQFLDMGLADVETESVVWTDNQFTALNRFGKSRYGELEISNSLPVSINVSEQKNSPVFMRVEYQYPNPPPSLGGFPSKIKIYSVSKGEYKPNLEITLYSVHLAERQLPHDFFGDDQFKTAETIYTNAYINSEVWGMVKKLNGNTYFTNVNNVKVVYPKKQDNAK